MFQCVSVYYIAFILLSMDGWCRLELFCVVLLCVFGRMSVVAYVPLCRYRAGRAGHVVWHISFSRHCGSVPACVPTKGAFQ